MRKGMACEPLPLVSIGVPTYYRPDGLRRLLTSLVNQTYQNLEIIVSDNCSPTLETEAIVKEFATADPRVRYFRQSQNIGLFYNFKFVFDQSSGEYFAWAADDDYRQSDYIESCIREFERSPALVLVNSYSKLVDYSTNQAIAIDKGCTTEGLPPARRYIKYLSTIQTEQAAVGDVIYGVIKRKVLTAAMVDQPNIIGWDHILLGRLALDGEFYTIPRELMESGANGASVDNAHSARIQLIQGSKSEQMPVWVRETYQQRSIRTSPALSPLSKAMLAGWSFSYYMLTHGLKMWVKSIAPGLFGFLKKMQRQKQASPQTMPE
jgi:glycosyltransferase involved in cell wall biosynthesis